MRAHFPVHTNRLGNPVISFAFPPTPLPQLLVLPSATDRPSSEVGVKYSSPISVNEASLLLLLSLFSLSSPPKADSSVLQSYIQSYSNRIIRDGFPGTYSYFMTISNAILNRLMALLSSSRLIKDFQCFILYNYPLELANLGLYICIFSLPLTQGLCAHKNLFTLLFYFSFDLLWNVGPEEQSILSTN